MLVWCLLMLLFDLCCLSLMFAGPCLLDVVVCLLFVVSCCFAFVGC